MEATTALYAGTFPGQGQGLLVEPGGGTSLPGSRDATDGKPLMAPCIGGGTGALAQLKSNYPGGHNLITPPGAVQCTAQHCTALHCTAGPPLPAGWRVSTTRLAAGPRAGAVLRRYRSPDGRHFGGLVEVMRQPGRLA